MKIVLASSSPRRKELLTLMGLEFTIMKPEYEEDMKKKLNFRKLSEFLALNKTKEILEKTEELKDRVIIGSDCMVYHKRKLLGKPKDKNEAFKMLKSLSNSTHKVVTSLCVIVKRGEETKTYLTNDVTKVKFNKLTNKDIENYLTFDEYKDKAGSYALQGRSGIFVKKIVGNMSTVIGLPIHILYQILKKENIM